MSLAAPEMSDATFLGYIAALAVSGVFLIVLAGLPAPMPALRRVTNGGVGALMAGYAIYLFFVFDGGSVYVGYYVFVLPVVLLVRTLRAVKADRARLTDIRH
jgi:hypothetical protein